MPEANLFMIFLKRLNQADFQYMVLQDSLTP